MPTFGPLGDGTDAENAGPSMADGIKPGQYTCFDSEAMKSTWVAHGLPLIKLGMVYIIYMHTTYKNGDDSDDWGMVDLF